MSVLAAVALAAGCVLGIALDRLLRRVVVRWCRDCGHVIGPTCVDCRDRHRAHNLRTARNQRDCLLADIR